MLLADKNAVIYGAAGTIGSATAKAFAAAGATVHLAGRTEATLAALADQIVEAGGRAQVAVVDALDEAAVDEHAAQVARSSLDISLNLVPRGDVQGVPLAQMSVADLINPVSTGLTATFITARAAARHMAAQGSGVILALNSGSSRLSPMMGGTGPTDGAIDTLIRNFAAELGPQGVRALGVYVAGIPETMTAEKLSAVNRDMQLDEAALAGLLAQLDQMRMTKRSPRLAEVASTLTFLASDQAAGITASWVNVTGGIFPS